VAWRNTLEFTVLALIVGYAVPFFVAILLNELCLRPLCPMNPARPPRHPDPRPRPRR
jgi:hypothetical protein